MKLHLKQHGLSKDRLYSTWHNMHYRCENPKDRKYKHYGGRGIKVCAKWKKFLPFYYWAIENGYADNLTIERRDNDKGYSPDNCTWVTIVEQQKNKTKKLNATSVNRTSICFSDEVMERANVLMALQERSFSNLISWLITQEFRNSVLTTQPVEAA